MSNDNNKIDKTNDSDLFREYIANNKNIRPLKMADKVNSNTSHKKPTHNTLFDYSNCLHATDKKNINNHSLSINLWRPLISSEEPIFYFQQGVQAKTISSIKNGKIAPDAVLDLHQKNSEQAAELFHHFIINSYQRNLRLICVVHGKGMRSDNKHPLLKNLVHHWLYEYNQILGFCSCPENLGGTGATLILLKKQGY